MEPAANEVALDDSAETEPLHPLLIDVFDGVDCGLAVFDADFTLIRANTLYLELCGYQPEDVPPGTSLQMLMSRSLLSRGFDESEIETATATTILRLKVGGTHKFRFRTAAGKHITVNRHRNPDGNLIETVHEVHETDGKTEGAERLRFIAELAHSRMMHALDAMIDGFALYDPEDRLVVYNEKYVELNPHIADIIKPGAQYEEMLRQGVARGGFRLNGMDEEAFINWDLQRHFNPGEPYERQLNDGRWIRTLERQSEDGSIVGTRTDITELKQRELEVEKISGDLDRTNDQFNVALNNMIQGLCMFGADQKLILCNRQYLDLYGFSPDIVKPGISLSDVMRYSISLGNYRDEDAQAALHARHDPKKLKERTTIKQYLRDGRVMAVMNQPMRNGGTIATYQDITILEQHEARLVAYMKKLEHSNRELQDFAHVASHDLQEPLRKIEAFGDRLMRKYGHLLPDDGRMYVDRMQNAAVRMRQLITDLLGYSRITTKAKPFQQVDLKEILTGVISDIQMRIEDDNGKVVVGDLPTFDADPSQMRQLFQNLLSNALKFKKLDVDPVVSVSAEHLTRPGENGEQREFWRIKVSDNGIGFDNKHKEQIFTIFQRLHGRFDYEGTGIGLATCRKIVERHEGTLDADGVPDEGATFTVELPAVQINNEEPI